MEVRNMEIMMLNDEELGEVVGGSNAGDGVAYVGAAASIIVPLPVQ